MANGNGSLLIPQSLLDFRPAFLAELAGISYTESVLEYLTNLFESESGNLWIKEDYQDPADAADSGIETKSTRGSHALHHGQESRGNNDV